MIESKYSFDNYGVVEGVVKTGEKVLVTVTVQSLHINEDNKAIIFLRSTIRIWTIKKQL
jgi:hypothetical protein